jgi:hypothetical protein
MPTDITVTELKETVTVTGSTTSITVTGDTATVAVATTTQPVNVTEQTNSVVISTVANKADIGLGAVDNTSDAAKPISDATQTALDTKVNKAGDIMTGSLVLSADPTSNLHAATKQYVDSAISSSSIASTDDLPEGSQNFYYTSTRANNDFDTRLSTKTTSNLVEGSNQYFTTARARSSISGAGSITYNSTTGVISYTGGSNPTTTDELPEGTNHLYYTNSRVDTRVATAIAAIDFPVDSVNSKTGAVVLSTTDISEGTNQYYTESRTDARVAAGIAAINFPVSSVNGQTAAVVLSTSDVAEGTNQYYTNERARLALSAGTGMSYSSTTGVIAVDAGIATQTYADNAAATAVANLVDSAPATLDTLNELATALGNDANFATTITSALGNKLDVGGFADAFTGQLAGKTTTDLAEGTNLYYTSSRANSDFDTRLGTKTTDALSEGTTNLYHTQSRARTAISATDAGGDGSISYDNTTGVLTYTGPSDSEVRAHFSAGTGISIVNGVVTNTGLTAPRDVLNVYAYVTNADSVTITKGQPVFLFSSTGNRASVKLAYNTGDATSAKTMGVADESITAGQSGFICTRGVVDGLNLGAYSEGATLYLGATAGTLTATKPYAPNHLVYIGVVERANNGNGQLYVQPQNGYELDEIHDVDLKTATPTEGQVLTYTASTGLWSAKTPAAGTTYTDAQARSAVANGVDLAVNGSNEVYVKSIRDATRLKGSIEATQNTSYVFSIPALSSTTGNNGFDISSSTGGTNGYGSQCSLAQYFGDTLAGGNTSAVFQFKTANGTSATSGTNPITGLSNTGPTATTINTTLGTLNFNGYGTTDFVGQIASRNQGGGLNAQHALQVQPYAKETFADATTTITPTVVSRTSVTLTSVVITGTKGQFTCATTTLAVGQAVQITGTLGGTGSISGYVTGNIYYVIATNGTTSFTLSSTMNGSPIDTTAGTPTGLTVTRNFVTFTYATQTTAPFTGNALIQVSGITGLTDGTYVAQSSSTTQTLIGAVTTSVALGTTPSLSIRDVTAAGTGFRVRGYAAATKMTVANRINFMDLSVATSTFKSDQFTVQGGTNTYNYLSCNAAAVTTNAASTVIKDLVGTTTFATIDSTKAAFTIPVGFPVKTAAQWRAITGAVGYQVCVSDSPTSGGRMAFWDTTNTRWSYISDNTAV